MEECPICYEEKSLIKFHPSSGTTQHAFCKDCITKSKVCPFCRCDREIFLTLFGKALHVNFGSSNAPKNHYSVLDILIEEHKSEMTLSKFGHSILMYRFSQPDPRYKYLLGRYLVTFLLYFPNIFIDSELPENEILRLSSSFLHFAKEHMDEDDYRDITENFHPTTLIQKYTYNGSLEYINGLKSIFFP